MIETYFGSDEVVLENFINKVSRHICQKHFSIPTARNFSVQCDHSLFSEKIVISAQKVSISSIIISLSISAGIRGRFSGMFVSI